MKIELPGARPPELEPPCAEPRGRKSRNRWEQDNAMSSRHQKLFFGRKTAWRTPADNGPPAA